MPGPKPTCPKCGSPEIRPIRYGLPPPEALPNDGSWIDGGCCIDERSPRWACKACGTRFGSIWKDDEPWNEDEPA